MCHPLRNAYKLRSLRDLPGDISGWDTTTQLVLVSVSAVAYTRILVSDHISACPYRPFSNTWESWLSKVEKWLRFVLFQNVKNVPEICIICYPSSYILI